MFTDDKSCMRWGIPIEAKDRVAEALQMVIRDVTNSEGVCNGTSALRRRGSNYWGGSKSCASRTELPSKPTPYTSLKGNVVAERGFGTIIGAARSLLLGAPHLRGVLWAKAVKGAIDIENSTPTDVRDGKVQLEVWEDT